MVKTKKVKNEVKKEIKEKIVRFIVVTEPSADLYSIFSMMRGYDVYYFSTMAEVTAFMKKSDSKRVRIFEVSSELKTRTRVELDI